MNSSWLKGLLITSVLVCAVSFGTLAWLALRTTDAAAAGRGQAGAPAPWQRILPEPGNGPDKEVMAALDQAAQAAARSVEELTARLQKLNQTAGIKPNELLLTFKSPQALRDFRNQAARLGLRLLHDDERLLTARVGYTDAAAMAEELRRRAEDLDNIGVNYLAWVPGLPDQNQVDTANAGGSAPYRNSGLDAIGAAGNREGWGTGTKVAVLDTGVTRHSTLPDSRVTHVDLVNDGQEPNGHGTAMASLIAGEDAANGGVAPATQILDIRVADTNGESNTALVAEGIMKAVDSGARVINISLGTTGDSVVLRRAVEYALSNNVLVVAAAGNEQLNALAYPAGYEGVISVGAVDANGNQAYFSNSGEGLVLAAPGVGIISAYSGDIMVMSSGTSQATAITTGVVSTLLSQGYQPQTIVATLVKNAQSTGAPKNQVGAGIVQVPKP